MLDLNLAVLWTIGPLAYLVKFVLHVLAIWVGTKVVEVRDAGFVQLAVVALLSYVISAVAGVLLSPLWLILFGAFGFFISMLSVAVALKLLVDTTWGKAWGVGFVAGIVWMVISLLIR